MWTGKQIVKRKKHGCLSFSSNRLNSCPIWVLITLFVFTGCKKPGDRTCFKNTGTFTSVEVPLDSVRTFRLYKNIRYHIYQDNARKIVIEGGEHVVNQIGVTNEDGIVSIHNNNKCNFLRDSEKMISVEIHYPYLNRFYIESSDSVVFENTVTNEPMDSLGFLILGIWLMLYGVNVKHLK